ASSPLFYFIRGSRPRTLDGSLLSADSIPDRHGVRTHQPLRSAVGFIGGSPRPNSRVCTCKASDEKSGVDGLQPGGTEIALGKPALSAGLRRNSHSWPFATSLGESAAGFCRAFGEPTRSLVACNYSARKNSRKRTSSRRAPCRLPPFAHTLCAEPRAPAAKSG